MLRVAAHGAALCVCVAFVTMGREAERSHSSAVRFLLLHALQLKCLFLVSKLS